MCRDTKNRVLHAKLGQTEKPRTLTNCAGMYAQHTARASGEGSQEETTTNPLLQNTFSSKHQWSGVILRWWCNWHVRDCFFTLAGMPGTVTVRQYAASRTCGDTGVACFRQEGRVTDNVLLCNAKPNTSTSLWRERSVTYFCRNYSMLPKPDGVAPKQKAQRCLAQGGAQPGKRARGRYLCFEKVVNQSCSSKLPRSGSRAACKAHEERGSHTTSTRATLPNLQMRALRPRCEITFV